MANHRVDVSSRFIVAAPAAVFQAFVDAQAVAAWLPPDGMTGRIDAFEPRAGGPFRMTLTYESARHAPRGKTMEHSDTVDGRFVEIVPDRRIVQAFTFGSDDPAFAGTMRMTWTLRPARGGTEVTVRAENVPVGIRREDHLAGLGASLANLAAFLEPRG